MSKHLDLASHSPNPQSPAAFSSRKTLVLGFGFLAISLTMSLYNSFMPLLLKSFLHQEVWVGAVMALRNVMSLTLQPYMVARSDQTWTRLGRRLPYLLVGMPAAAVFFVAIPFSHTLLWLIVLDILFNVSLSVLYGPTIALMPDTTPSQLRSRANGLINLMGGVGALLAFFVVGRLASVSPVLPYIVAGLVLLLAPWLVKAVIQEPAPSAPSARTAARRENGGNSQDDSSTSVVGLRHLWNALWEVVSAKDKSTLYLLLAIFFWFFGENSVNVFFTSYGVNELHKSASASMVILGVFSVSFLLFAIPSGWLASRIGRRKVIAAGLVGLFLVFAAMSLVKNVPLVYILMLVGGAAWAGININSYPWVSDMTLTQIGAYTGLYYLSSGLADAIGQPIVGRIIDAFGFPSMFLAASLTSLVALFFIWLAKSQKATA